MAFALALSVSVLFLFLIFRSTASTLDLFFFFAMFFMGVSTVQLVVSPLVKSLRHCFNVSILFACAKFWVLVHTLWKSLLQALILILSFTLQPSNRFLIIDLVFLFNCMMRMIPLIAQVMRNKPDSKYETMGRGEALS